VLLQLRHIRRIVAMQLPMEFMLLKHSAAHSVLCLLHAAA
jgi:hypothetical protein